jgi:hypothetical protein
MATLLDGLLAVDSPRAVLYFYYNHNFYYGGKKDPRASGLNGIGAAFVIRSIKISPP